MGIAFCLGYAELTRENGRVRRFNSAVLVEADGRMVGRYRKVHLPGHADHRPHNPFQNLERRYFEPGDLGFGVWPACGGRVGMLICNDRRWPEAYRLLGLQAQVTHRLRHRRGTIRSTANGSARRLHHQLCLQAGAYQNGMWVVAAAEAGVEEGVEQIGGSLIVASG